MIQRLVLSELARHLRRNLRHMCAELTPGDDRDNRLIDFVHHMETLVQQIETELKASPE